MNKIYKIILLIIAILLVGYLVTMFVYQKPQGLKDVQRIEKEDLIVNKNKKPKELMRKDGNKLILKLDNGTEKIYEDRQEDSNHAISYIPVSFHEDINYYEIRVVQYEGEYYLLVNKKTGNEISIPGGVIVSPDKNRIVSYGMDLIAGYSFNGFEILKMDNNDNFVEEYKEETDWGPSNAKWINDSELEFEKAVVDDNFDLKINGIINYKLIESTWVKEM